MRRSPEEAAALVATQIKTLICPGCACLCDDLVLRAEAGQLVEVANVCRWGAAKLFGEKRFHRQQPRKRWPQPQLRVRGHWEAVTYETAISRAAEILTAARQILIFGLTCLGSWAQAAALRLGQHLQARLEPADLPLLAPYYQSGQEEGFFAATLEVIRDQADTVVFWGANPLHATPRQLVRYAVFARGRFLERGAEDRRVAVVDIHPTEMQEVADLFLKIKPAEEVRLAEEVTRIFLAPQTQASSAARKLAEFLRQGDYGAIFVGRGVTYGAAGPLWRALTRLAAVLNRDRPFVLLPLPADFNSAGWYNLVLRELGHPWAVDFRPGRSQSWDQALCSWQEMDAVLVAGGDPLWFFSDPELAALRQRQVPLIVMTPFANRTSGFAEIILPVAAAGLETPEVAYRLDSLPFLLDGGLASNHLSDVEILTRLAAVLGWQDHAPGH